MPATLVLGRHGQSLWNAENRFTGWVDVPLTLQGKQEALQMVQLLRDVPFDVAYTSMLRRAYETLDIILRKLGEEGRLDAGLLHFPVIRHSALNERSYSDLEGLDKAETAAAYGSDMVHRWRRSFHTQPPNGESLAMTCQRTIPFFERAILGDAKRVKNVLVIASQNSLRAIVMRLSNLPPEAIEQFELATGEVLLYAVAPDGAATVQDRRSLHQLAGDAVRVVP